MGFKKLSQDIEYDADEGVLKLILRRPVPLYVPSELVGDYDPQTESEAPDVKPQLDWVYGYRGRNGRNNILPLASGEVVYFVAGVAVLYNPAEKTQRFYAEHTDDITSMAVHPEGSVVATGQTSGRNKDLAPCLLRVWSSEDLSTLHVLGADFFPKAVCCLAFSPDGNILAAVDESPEPILSVWDWNGEEENQLMHETKCSSDQVLGICYTSEDDPRIVTIGKSHIAFWTSPEGSLEKSNGVFEGFEKPKYITSVVCNAAQQVVTGDFDGSIIRWTAGDNSIEDHKAGAHEGSILFLFKQEDGNILSAGTDGKIIEWDADLEPTGREVEIPEEYGHPRALALLDDTLVVGTTKNSLLQGVMGEELELVSQGHLEELWGLAAHPSEAQFVTAGMDGMVYLRDTTDHSVLWSRKMEEGLQSAAFTSDGNFIILGTVTGKWFVIDQNEEEPVFECQNGDEPIQVLQFSPDGSFLAVGSRDNNIYIHKTEDDFKSYSEHGVCEGHTSFITHLDWSADGQVIRSNSGDYELLYWSAEDCSQMTDSADQKDLEWATHTCTLAFRSLGIWPKGVDGTDVNACGKAHDQDLLAAGDDFGCLKLFKYPVIYENANHHKGRGHSSHVTAVVFSSDDSLILSAGGRDNTAMQWTLVPVEE